MGAGHGGPNSDAAVACTLAEIATGRALPLGIIRMKVVRARCDVDKDGKGVFKDIGRIVDTKKGPMLKLDVIPVNWDGFAWVMDPLPKKESAEGIA